MKKHIILFLLFIIAGLSASAQNDAIDRYFSKYQNDKNFSVVSVSPKMFQMFSKVDWQDVDPGVKELISNLHSFKLLSTESDGEKYYKEAVDKLHIASYDELMTVRDGNDNVKFLVKENGNTIHELLMLVGSDSEFLLLSFVGNINLDQLAKLGQAVNMKGMDKLKDVKQPKQNH